jgi:hypothetical protein
MSIPLIPYSYGVEVFIFHWIYTQSVGLLGRVIGPSEGLYLNTGQHKHGINVHTHTNTQNIHALSGIRTHDHSVRASEDSSCLRPLGCRDRRIVSNWLIFLLENVMARPSLAAALDHILVPNLTGTGGSEKRIVCSRNWNKQTAKSSCASETHHLSIRTDVLVVHSACNYRFVYVHKEGSFDFQANEIWIFEIWGVMVMTLKLTIFWKTSTRLHGVTSQKVAISEIWTDFPTAGTITFALICLL